MPIVTYSPIATTTVGSGGATNIDFQNIPSTYTDLLVKVSIQANNSASSSYALYTKINNDSANHSYHYMRGSGSAIATGKLTNQSDIYIGEIPSTFVSSTFGNAEIYITNYTSGNHKSMSIYNVTERNDTNAWATICAGLWSGSAAINRITLSSSVNLAQYSTATLYGIINV